MPVHGHTPILCCVISMWTILTVSSHPQHSKCNLMQRTALCKNASLLSVPAGLPVNIKELFLNHNYIQTLQNDSLLHYPSLGRLNLACNNLEKLESNVFQHSKLLESLNLANNNLHMGHRETSDALKRLPELRSLDLSENKLDNEMAAALLQNLTSLEYLNLSGNLLQRLDETSFKALNELKELDLQRNILFEIDSAFDSNPKLQRLNMAFNFLPCLTDFDMTQLVLLNVSHNFIEWFISRQDYNDTFQIETLDLSNNRLLFFPFLPNLSHLRNLYLSHNLMSFYEHLEDDATFPNSTKTVEYYNLDKHVKNITAKLWDEGFHGDISSLQILDLRGNLVQYFPKGFIEKMPVLFRLRMSTNCLETLNLTSTRFSSSLYELDVSNNKLSQIVADNDSMTALENLTYLNLSLNSLGRLPSGLFSSMSSIRSVDLSYTNIETCPPEEAETPVDSASACVDWKNVVSLQQLYLKGCNVKRVSPSAFTGLSLTHLDLSDNPGLIAQQSIKSLSKTLKYLGIGNTHISDLDFSDFRRLKFLNVSGNSLVYLPGSILNLDIKLLDLRDNKLSTILPWQANALAPKLQTIFLTGNPFNCCQTEWFRTFETTQTLNMVGQSSIECKDLFQTHKVQYSKSFLCFQEGEPTFWYIVLFVPVCLLLLSISFVALMNLRAKIVEKSVKKKCLKPTSY